MPNAGTLASVAIPADLEAPMEKVPGIRSVEKISFIPTRVGSEQMLILARDFERGQDIPLDLETGSVDDAWDRLADGEVVIGTVLARRTGLKAGEEIELPTRAGRKRFRIAGTTTDYTVGGMVAFMDWNAARNVLKFNGVDAFLVRCNPEQRELAATSIEKFCKDNSLQLQTNADLRALIDELVNGVVGFLWLLMFMVFVVASLGIVNTLTMNVIEQTREIAVLRAVAMTRRQIRRMIISQAFVIGAIALIPGGLAGLGLAYLVSLTNSMVVGNPVPFTVNHWFNILACVTALFTALLAALPPAERAARLSVAGALQYE
jgi:putative ABC transport system permease protein